MFCNLGLFVNLGLKLANPASAHFIIDNNVRLGILGLSVYHAAFVCEALRSGINTVPPGQAEAARSVGLTFTQNLRYVVLPQAFRGAEVAYRDPLPASEPRSSLSASHDVMGVAGFEPATSSV